MQITYTSISNIGDRNKNEDSWGIKTQKDFFLFAVADGLGGHGKGDVASNLAVQTISARFDKQQIIPAKPDMFLSELFLESQKKIMEKQQEENSFEALKTTLSILLIGKNAAYLGYIGDTRIYHFRNNKIVLRTLDHSVPQYLVDTGEIKEKKIRRHPDRNRLLRVLGIEWNVPRHQVYSPLTIHPGDAFLICSDGFWEYIHERIMEKTLKKSASVHEWLDSMNTIVQRNKKNKDNNTAIAVWIR